MDFDDDDFIGALDDSLDDAATALEAGRSELVAWAAAALMNRHPDAAPFRGVKGLLTCQGDLDVHLQHLHGSLRDRDAERLREYARWQMRVLVGRGMQPEHVARGVSVLAEALGRFLPANHGTLIGSRLNDAFAINFATDSERGPSSGTGGRPGGGPDSGPGSGTGERAAVSVDESTGRESIDEERS